jgi:hypothetical protein
MELDVLRYNSEENYTGSLFMVDKKFECFSLEDEHRVVKVKGETRIPDGRYKVEFRNVGGFNKRYQDKFGDFHKGMLWVKDVPGFEFILIHIGNDEDDTAGCLLLGTTADASKGFIGGSTGAYKKAYAKISHALLRGDDVWIHYNTIG